VRIKNEGALPTKVYVKTQDGRSIPFINQEEMAKKIEEINTRNNSILENMPSQID